MKRNPPWLALAILFAAYLAAGAAEFLAPYPSEQQHRDHPWSPPSTIRWQQGGFTSANPVADRKPARVVWLPKTPQGGWKLFGTEEHGTIFLIGADGLGRDQFSRLLHGARVSLYSGLAAALLSALLGWLLGGTAGFAGGWTDRVLMQLAELFLALPWMYLLLAARAFFPLNSDPRLVFTILLLLLGAIGWARPARLIRAVVLSAKERDSVLAARGFGASRSYLLFQHVLPVTMPVLLTYLSVAIPQYIAAEATLSFLGLGFSGSIPSWGGLIASLSNLEVIMSYWWMWFPAAALALVLACYSSIANGLSEARMDNH